MNDFYVYALFRPWDGSPFYIGKGRGRRWLHHERRSYRPNRMIDAIVRKAARLGLDIPKVKIRSGLTEPEAFEIEIALIAAIGRKDRGGPLVNMTNGGEGPTGPKTEAHRRNISIALKGHAPHLPSLEKIRLSNIGRPLTAEHREKLRQAKVGRALTPEHRAKIAASMKARFTTADTSRRR